jgi:hypothetical protein
MKMTPLMRSPSSASLVHMLAQKSAKKSFTLVSRLSLLSRRRARAVSD